MSDFRPCFLIPCYNHGKLIHKVVDKLIANHPYPIIIVDDGSDRSTRIKLDKLKEKVILVTLFENNGKGAAFVSGVKKAHELGFSHAFQIDADGQHDLNAVPLLIKESQNFPASLISGKPIYDESVPKKRLYGRYITHFWVWVETLSFDLKDSMCGFRSYPIALVIDLLEKYKIGTRMDFDTDIMVKLYWENVESRFIDIKVNYPEDGISHFRMVRDNIKLIKMHVKLILGMFVRLPNLLLKKTKQKETTPHKRIHWSRQKEKGTYYGIKFMLGIYSVFGRTIFKILLSPVMFYYVLTASSIKKSSQIYLENLNAYSESKGIPLPKGLSTYAHLSSFAETILDKLAAWKGDYSPKNLIVHDADLIEEVKEKKKGIFILGSHLGNLELSRALSKRHRNIVVNALVFTKHSKQFNAVMKAINPNSDINIINVDTLGPETAMLLDDKIQNGEWVVIVGDRTSTSIESRSVWVDFLGKPAPFPQGPFLLASILKAPVYLLFALRDDHGKTPYFNLHFEHFSDEIKLNRSDREKGLKQVIQQYAKRLEHYTFKAPLQWYNFFDFWKLSGKDDDK